MIDLNEYPIFAANKTTLKETSKSAPDGKNVTYLTESQMEVVDFDSVKKEYCTPFHLNETPYSNDALHMSDNGELTFVEFKNGAIDNIVLRRKCFDSLLIFTGIVDRGICYTREHMDYILVYNPEKRTISKDKISRDLLKKGGLEFVKGGLGYFKGYCFKNVYTYTPEEFEKEFVRVYDADAN